MYNFQTLKQSLFSSNSTSIYTITLISIFLFALWTVTYGLIIFKQFSWIQILSVFIIFMVILIFFTYFFTDFFKNKLNINSKNIMYAFLLFVLMCLLSSTLPSVANQYFHTFPLLETELGLGWHKDTAFHVSLIQSIFNFGYPSIAQHGAIFNFYHVLSHYIDTLIIFVTHLEPYDSYGLLFMFKIWIIISSITIFIATTIKNIHPLFYLFIFLFIVPIFSGSWQAISSHGLWLTTILLIFGSLKVFKIFMLKKLDNVHFYFLFLFLVLITFGKISSGLMSASLIGLFLLIKYPRDKRVYFLGFLLSIFFIFYIKLFSKSYGSDISISYDFSLLTIKYFYNTITNYNSSQNIMINSSLVLLYFIFYIFNNKNAFIVFVSAILSYCILIVLTAIKTDLSLSDIWYFYFALTYILNLLTFQIIVYQLQNHKISMNHDNSKQVFFISLLISVIYISSFYVSSKLSIMPVKIIKEIESLNTRPFTYINKKLPIKEHISIFKLITNNNTSNILMNFERPLYNFREKINQILINQHISKNEALLFVPKEIYEKDISRFGGAKWAEGMLIYAITGIPLLYGINNNKQKAYTQQDYNSSHLWKRSVDFSFKKVCQKNPSKTILKLDDFNRLKFTVYRCNEVN